MFLLSFAWDSILSIMCTQFTIAPTVIWRQFTMFVFHPFLLSLTILRCTQKITSRKNDFESKKNAEYKFVCPEKAKITFSLNKRQTYIYKYNAMTERHDFCSVFTWFCLKLVISLLCLFVSRWKNPIAVCYCYSVFEMCVPFGWLVVTFFYHSRMNGFLNDSNGR